jgi:Ca2+-binding RTX toxin-like protein
LNIRRLLFLTVAAAALFAVVPASASALCNGMAATVGGATAGNDTLTGTAGPDVIEGLGGDDTINGGGGADTICGDDGDDTINGQGDNDSMFGGTNTTVGDTVTFVDITVGAGPSLTVDLVAETAVATAPISTTDTVEEFENVTGSATFDDLRGDAGPNVLTGLGAPDGFIGRGGNDTLSDNADGLFNEDSARYPDATGPVTADVNTNMVVATGVGTDTLVGIDDITGGPFDDVLTGNNVDPGFGSTGNYLNGGGGNDLIEPRGASDAINGGGNAGDRITYANEGNGNNINLATGTATTLTGTDSIIGIRDVTGSSSGDDTITGDSFANDLDGGGGGATDTVSFGGVAAGVDASLASSTASGQGADTLTGFDNLTGSSESDVLTGDAFSTNVLNGNAGANDVASFSGGPLAVTVTLAGGAGTTNGQGNDTLANIDSLRGSSEADTLTGDANDNVIEGLGGGDALDGGTAGNDTASFATLPTSIEVSLITGTANGQGLDTLANFDNVIGSTQDDLLVGDAASNSLDGNSGANDMAGFFEVAQAVNASLVSDTASGQGSDTLPNIESLSGSTLDDTLTGDANANTIEGQAGADSITGGLSADTLVLGAGMDVITANDGVVDTINCTGGGPDSGSVDGPAPAETYTSCDTDSDTVVDFLDSCPTTAGSGLDGCVPTSLPPAPTPTAAPTTTGQRAAALKKCKKKKSARGRRKCRKRANKLPV